MASEMASDKLSLKNILFTKALPNYTIPVATDDYKTYPCTDCGDKFIFESSYNDHINRKSLQITYFCRPCCTIVICKNRCKLLSHIRSHAFKTATINVSDLKIAPLSIQDINWTLPTNNVCEEVQIMNHTTKCYECEQIIDITETIPKDRAKHYMKYTNIVFSCPICLFSLPNSCSLTAHLRIHFQIPPYFCPECGLQLSSKSNHIYYPYNHDCEGFNMIRATTRIKCQHENCYKIFHPTDYKEHIKDHLSIVNKCIGCSVMWSKEPPENHLNCKNNKVFSYVQCQLCLEKFSDTDVNKHLYMHYKNTTEHIKDQVYPCMTCNVLYGDISDLIRHQIGKHVPKKTKIPLLKILNNLGSKIYHKKNDKNKNKYSNDEKGYYRVIKKCDKCLRSFIYRCAYENIKILPNECPYKCALDNHSQEAETNENRSIVCYLCKRTISEKWENIKIHFAEFHKNHKCLDLKVVVTSIDHKITHSKNNLRALKRGIGNSKNKIKNKDNARKGNYFNNREDEINTHTVSNVYECNICNLKCIDKQTFETHIVTHKDPCMAYQCLECGQCFVVKPSFSTHLLLQHGINDVNEYIVKKQCFNEFALLKQPNNQEQVEPVKENQCKICKDQFDNLNDLEKHFRVHGMAFLMKNTTKNGSP